MFDFIKNRRGEQIFVVLDHPKGTGPWPAVLIIHGFKGSSPQRHLKGISDALVEAGFLTLRPDLTRDPGRSYLEFADMTYGQELEDVEDVLGYLLKLPEVDQSRVGITGHSLGGMIAAEVASRRQEIRALAVLSGVYSFEFVAEHIFNKPYQKAKKEFSEKGWTTVWSQALQDRLKIKRAFYEDIIARSADYFVKNIKCPTLVVSGEKDEAVSPIHANKWMKSLGCADKKMEIISGADHDYTGESLHKVTGIVSDWFVEKLR